MDHNPRKKYQNKNSRNKKDRLVTETKIKEGKLDNRLNGIGCLWRYKTSGDKFALKQVEIKCLLLRSPHEI